MLLSMDVDASPTASASEIGGDEILSLGDDPDPQLQCFILAKSAGPPYTEASRILGSMLSKPFSHSALLEDQIRQFSNALLAKPGSDVAYVQVLSLLSDDLLQKLLIEVVQFYRKPHDIEIRCAVLLNLQNLFPRSIDEYRILELFMETGNILLEEASRKYFAFSNKYRACFVTELLPLLMSSTKSEELLPYYDRELCEVVRFYMGCLLNTFPDEETVAMHPAACWQSVFQFFIEIARSAKVKLPKLWNLDERSSAELGSWWRRYMSFRNTPGGGVTMGEDMDFFLISVFWTFLIVMYSDLKTEFEMPGRRPFLLRSENDGKHEISHTGTTMKQKASRRLREVLALAAQVWDTMNLPSTRLKTSRLASLLHLDDSSIYLAFRWDVAVLTKVPLILLAPSDLHPSWLKTQLLSQHVIQNSKQGLNQSLFEDVLRLIRTLRVQTVQTGEGKQSESLRYVWSDHEVMSACCSLMVDHLAKQPLDRAADDYLSVLLIILQPVASEEIAVFQQLLCVIASRQKFVFKRFFDFVVLPDVLCEFSGLLGKVVLELQAETPTVTAPVHKTRGANRESTEALQSEFQRHIANGQPNPFVAVQRYLRAEKDNIARILFSGSNISPKRGRPNSS